MVLKRSAQHNITSVGGGTAVMTVFHRGVMRCKVVLGTLGSNVAGEPSHRPKASSNTEEPPHQAYVNAGCADSSFICQSQKTIQT